MIKKMVLLSQAVALFGLTLGCSQGKSTSASSAPASSTASVIKPPQKVASSSAVSNPTHVSSEKPKKASHKHKSTKSSPTPSKAVNQRDGGL